MKITLILFSALFAAFANAAVYDLLPNGSMEMTGTDGLPAEWRGFGNNYESYLSSCDDSHKGDRAIKIKTGAKVEPDTVAATTGIDNGGRLGYPLVAGGTYRLKAFVRSNGPCIVRLYANFRDGGGGFAGTTFSKDIHTINEWREYEHVYQVPSGVVKGGCGIFVYTPDAEVLIDDVSLTYDTLDNQGLKDIYVKVPPKEMSIDLAVSGGELRIDGKATTNLFEGIHAFTIVADSGTPLRISSGKNSILERRWRVKAGTESAAEDPMFDDREWKMAEFAADGSVVSPCEGSYMLRQVVMWNAAIDSQWKLFLARCETFSMPAGALDPMLAALYSPFGFPFEDFAINFEMPGELRFADTVANQTPTLKHRQVVPDKVVTERGRWSFIYNEVRENSTRITLLPLVAFDTLSADTEFKYYRTANGNFTELPVTVPVKALPAIHEIGEQPFAFQGYEDGQIMPQTREFAELYFEQCRKIGVNRYYVGGETDKVYPELFIKANPKGELVHAYSGSFPLTIGLWGCPNAASTGMLEFMRENPESQVTFAGRAFKPTLKQDFEHKIHYAAWCPSWLNGEGKASFQSKLAELMAKERESRPGLKHCWIDWEVTPSHGGQMGKCCFCDKCRERFFAAYGLDTMLTDDQILADHKREWNEFRLHEDAKSICTIEEALERVGMKVLFYSEGTPIPVYELGGKLEDVFGTMPGNSPAVGWRQKIMDRNVGGILEKSGAKRFIAQRFARLGPGSGKDAWKTMTICSQDGKYQDDKIWKSQVVRMLVTCKGGMDLQSMLYYPASVHYWIAEGMALVAPHADLIRNGTRCDEEVLSDDIASPMVLAVKNEKDSLICLFNESTSPKTVTYTFSGSTNTVTIAAEDVLVNVF